MKDKLLHMDVDTKSPIHSPCVEDYGNYSILVK